MTSNLQINGISYCCMYTYFTFLKFHSKLDFGEIKQLVTTTANNYDDSNDHEHKHETNYEYTDLISNSHAFRVDFDHVQFLVLVECKFILESILPTKVHC